MKYVQPKKVSMPATYDGMGRDKTNNGLPVKKIEKTMKIKGTGAATQGLKFSKNG